MRGYTSKDSDTCAEEAMRQLKAHVENRVHQSAEEAFANYVLINRQVSAFQMSNPEQATMVKVRPL
jgi:hypothetical protein